MESVKTFKTKRGFCHILPDKIVLTRDGVIGNVAKVTVGNNIARILLIYGAITVGLFYFGYEAYKNGQTLQPILFGLVGLYLIYGIVSSLNNSATPIIDREKIKDVKLKKAVKGLTRSRFEVQFEDENGKIKKRLIMLPGSLTDGQNETEKAVEIMREEELLK
ncbi:phosphoribosylaminoimidazolesuccinocarboxamide synthase [Muricauda sp. CAU 1633]|uniref:phosphoribosylaminoimidazolesuccinocarboxamide synthase n=1 Tax=Allomuricauda sp. CAU 1633 TaxID=2816036 RepID=UPI001A8E37B1|nr:phosphoribosylaminoimidazolesuccinocarboxamide synthase [Muricauda sp. CAU 1633]MBO0320891.1 phosphoribosylaminoimidazolesuccinocarboxamide synthase [Muricauda sp. CAU 1633]